ncbi:MAG: NAD(P)-dependent glycerol-3-phosphate dehydrogenase [Methylococcaceae bacterium]|nr:NAD(P)-dependent glycerol-3-phosphate dehydrogenase [Methylococcaceae bacterium]
MANVTVFGAGSWGTALAILLARNGHRVLLWGHHERHMAALAEDRNNRRYLPGTGFPETLSTTADLPAAARFSSLWVVAVPSHAFRQLLETLRPHCSPEGRIAWATKGLELETGKPLHRVVGDVLGPAIPAAVLSGPTFAREVAAGQPTAMTVASENIAFAGELVRLLHNDRFRAYSSSDIVGVELGGAIKNVLAIAAGVADGLGYGANARAALITRGLAEMMRLGTTLGGRPDTLMGLSGVGDLILTCTDNQSRNRRFGVGIGQGRDRQAVTDEIGQEIEGIPTAKIVHALAQRHAIDMPITEQTYRILYEALPPAEAVTNLLLRDPKPETSLD